MYIIWEQVFPAGAIGIGIGWLFRYLFVRWCEKRHIDEQLVRGEKALALAEKLFELHERACDRNVNIAIPLGNQVFELMPITDNELEEDEEQALNTITVGRLWLISLMWHCVNLTRIKGAYLTVDDAIAHAEECFVAAYNEFDAHSLMHEFGDITQIQMIHAYHDYVTNRNEATIDAVVQAMENWVEAQAEEDVE